MQSICRTCLLQMFDNTSAPLRLEHFYKYQLMFCVPEMDLRAIPDAKLCKDCAATILAIYKFKINYQEVEYEVNKQHFDMTAQLTVNKKIRSDNKSYAFCRTCLAVVKHSSFPFFAERHDYKQQLMFCVPEMNLQSVPDIALCDDCHIMMFDTFYKFKTKCLDVEKILKELLKLHKVDDIGDLFVKNEVYIKEEISDVEDFTIKQEELDLVNTDTACTTRALVPYSESSEDEHDANTPPDAIEERRFPPTPGVGRVVQDIACKPCCKHHCARHFTTPQRHEIRKFFRGLGTYARQRNWLITCIEQMPIHRRRQSASISRRQHTWKYFMNWNAERVEVCQQFLLSTLNISQMTIRYACYSLQKSKKFAVQKPTKFAGPGRYIPSNKTPLDVKRAVHRFIKQFPAVQSRHCRSDTSTRKYLPAELRNVSFFYRLFTEQQDGLPAKIRPSIHVFREIFRRDFDLGFHQPKKDKCRMCEHRKDDMFQETDASKAAFAAHLLMKDQSEQLFLADQKRHLCDPSYVCASFDLQKVLPTPYGDNLFLYYSRKYSFYNETVYESGTIHGTCFIWGEADGKRGCNEICTIMFKYLEGVDRRGLNKHILLYCDSCPRQNHNRAMLVMLHTFLQGFAHTVETVKIVFLLPGHTYLSVDSVHATIERFVRKRIVWAPSEWDTILRSARVKPKPLTVIRMQHSDFRNWKQFGDNYLPADVKTADGKPLHVSVVKQALFHKGSTTFGVNYTYEAGSSVAVALPPECGYTAWYRTIPTATLYPEPLPIARLKKRDLRRLCRQNVIPQRYQPEYLALHSDASVPDALAETDAEDSESDIEPPAL